MSKIITDIVHKGLSDSELKGFGWSKNGEDLWLKFSLADDTTVTILFTWVTSLLINVDFGNYFGMPLVFESHFNTMDDMSWEVEIIFGAAPEGKIKFNCNNITLGDQ